MSSLHDSFLKRSLPLLFIALIAVLAMFFTGTVGADSSKALELLNPTVGNPLEKACSEGPSAESQFCQDNEFGAEQGEQNPLIEILATVNEVLYIVIAIAAVIMIIISAIKYTTSGGSAERIASAKKTLIYALVGLVVSAFSATIINLVLK